MSGDNADDEDVGFLYKAMRNRDPRKRRVKPVQKHLLQVNFGDDDSDNDSDYQVKSEDMSEDEQGVVPVEPESTDNDNDNKSGSGRQSDDGSESSDSDSGGSGSSDDEGSDTDDDDRKTKLFYAMDSEDEDDEDYVPKKKQKPTDKQHVEKQRIRSPDIHKPDAPVEEMTTSTRPMKVLICCVCLGDISETDDEIVECDNCGVAVHEGCYGISDNQSAASTESSASTEPWFCDACKAGVKPDCELCPNEGGIFKETDAGKWVHLVCALYTPGVAFGDVDKLSPVTLFEMPYSKWGMKECSLCEDTRFIRTGVCVSCDAGMCRSYFHVTCAQRNGLLSEASPDEDIADPFYAYCKLHADKITSRAKRRNYLAIQSHVRQHASMDIQDEKEKIRFKRKLNHHKQKYQIAKSNRPPSWVPTVKMVRYLTSSPSVVKKMLRKAELMGIITQSHHVAHSNDKQERKKSNAALSAEFVTYYLDRNVRIEKLKSDIKDLEKQNEKLRKQDHTLRHQYDMLKDSTKSPDTCSKLRNEGEKLWSLLSDLAGKPLPTPEILKLTKVRSPTRKELPKSQLAVINQCGICCMSHDQHQLARCDKCHLWYHLGCLDPPLTRMPKKTSRMGWQCSQCADSSSEDSDAPAPVNVDAPRRLREKIKEPAKFSLAEKEMEFLFPNMHARRGRQKKKTKGKKKVVKKETTKPVNTPEPPDTTDEKSHDVCINPESADGTSNDAIWEGIDADDDDDLNIPSEDSPMMIDISDEEEDASSMEVEVKITEETTPIYKLLPQSALAQQDVSRTGRRIIKKKHYDEDEHDSDTSPKHPTTSKKPTPEKDGTIKPVVKTSTSRKSFGTFCVTCSKQGDRSNMVSCDLCEQCYHFACLNPPFKKTPKTAGYTWHCEACDSSDGSDEEQDDEPVD